MLYIECMICLRYVTEVEGGGHQMHYTVRYLGGEGVLKNGKLPEVITVSPKCNTYTKCIG